MVGRSASPHTMASILPVPRGGPSGHSGKSENARGAHGAVHARYRLTGQNPGGQVRDMPARLPLRPSRYAATAVR